MDAKTQRVLTSLLWVLLSNTCEADVNWWTQMGRPIPGGGVTVSLAVHPVDHSFLVGLFPSGTFRSQDRGNTWHPFSPTGGFVPVISIHPTGPDTIYVGSSNGIWKTPDNGGTWRRVLAEIIYCMKSDTRNPEILYCGTSNGVFKSTDSGETWETNSEGLETEGGILPYVHTIDIDPRNPEIVYAIASQKNKYNFISTTGTNPELLPEKASLFGLFKSGNGGHRWERIGMGLPDSSEKYTSSTFVVESTEPATLYFTTPVDLFRSQDGGETFHQIEPPGADSALYNGISTLISFQDQGSLLYTYGSGSGIFKSRDSGETWHPVNGGLPFPPRYGPLYIPPHVPDTLYRAASASVWSYINRTSDLNEDGTVDLEDAIIFASGFGTRNGDLGYQKNLDLDENGNVNFRDFLAFVRGIGQ